MKKNRRIYSISEQLALFDFENFKRKVRENPKKYDKINNLIPLVEEARKKSLSEIRLENVELYMNDVWVLNAIDCYLEYEPLGACCEWYYYIFLTKEAHQNYLDSKARNLVEDLSSFVLRGII